MTSGQTEAIAHSQTTGTVGQGIERAAAGVHEAIEVLAGFSRPLADQLVSNAHMAVDRVSGLATSAVQLIGVENDALRDAQLKLVESARLCVQEHPLASLSLALVAGFTVDRVLVQGIWQNSATQTDVDGV